MSGPAISHGEYERRLAAVRAALAVAGFDALLAVASTMRPGDSVYLGGYAPTNGFATVVLTPSELVVLADQAWDTALTDGAWLEGRLRPSQDVAADIASLLGTARRVAVSGSQLLSWETARELERRAHVELVAAPEIVAGARRIKSAEEIAALREAARITSAGAHAFLAGAVAGVTERELAADVQAALTRAGSGRLAFPLVLGSGPQRSATAAPLPGDRPLVEGDLVLLDCGATWQGYCGDISRVACVGDMGDEQRRLLEAVHACHAACVALVGPGVGTDELHALAVAQAAAHGFELPFLLGHATGCANWEPPAIDGRERAELVPGMVITIEPGIYVPGVGGARLEDMLLVTESGSEILTDAPLVSWR